MRQMLVMLSRYTCSEDDTKQEQNLVWCARIVLGKQPHDANTRDSCTSLTEQTLKQHSYRFLQIIMHIKAADQRSITCTALDDVFLLCKASRSEHRFFNCNRAILRSLVFTCSLICPTNRQTSSILTQRSQN